MKLLYVDAVEEGTGSVLLLWRDGGDYHYRQLSTLGNTLYERTYCGMGAKESAASLLRFETGGAADLYELEKEALV